MIKKEEAQMYTIEGLTVAMLMLITVIFAIKAAPLTPLTTSASHQNVEAQLEMMGQDLINVLDYGPSGDSDLKIAVIKWTGSQFRGQRDTINPTEVNNIANVLQEVLGNNGIAYDLEVSYQTDSGIITEAVLWNGLPSDNAVTVSRKIVLHDDDNVVADTKIIDMDPTTEFYNIVDVRLTLWRM